MYYYHKKERKMICEKCKGEIIKRIDSLYIIPKRKIRYTDIELQRMEIYADVLNQVKRVFGLKK